MRFCVWLTQIPLLTWEMKTIYMGIEGTVAAPLSPLRLPWQEEGTNPVVKWKIWRCSTEISDTEKMPVEAHLRQRQWAKALRWGSMTVDACHGNQCSFHTMDLVKDMCTDQLEGYLYKQEFLKNSWGRTLPSSLNTKEETLERLENNLFLFPFITFIPV